MKNQNNILTASYRFRVPFRDCDPLQIVWHGNYLKYFEDAKEDFCRKHGISYADIQNNGYAAPVVKSVSEYKHPLHYNEVARVEVQFINHPAAKIIFQYKIYNEANVLACTGETIQVFLNAQGELQLAFPPFFKNWKKNIFK